RNRMRSDSMNEMKIEATSSLWRIGKREIAVTLAATASILALGAIGYIIYEKRNREDTLSTSSEDQIPSVIPAKAVSEEHFENSQVPLPRKRRSLKICRSAADRMKKISARAILSDGNGNTPSRNSLNIS
uniref:Ovule protein n=1 Tax=Parascaris univalens TaxID=6257 RepID=A0A915AU76_PARUN